MAAAVAAAWLVGYPLEIGGSLPMAIGAALIVANAALGLYPGAAINPVVETRQVVVSTSVVFAVTLLASWAAGAGNGTVFFLAAAWLLSVVVLPVGRFVGRALFCGYAWWMQPIAILGDRRMAQQVAALLRRWPTLGLQPMDRASHSHPWIDTPSDDAPYLCSPHQVPELIDKHGVRWAILALPEQSASDRADLLAAACRFPHLLVIDEAPAFPSLWSATLEIDGYSARSIHLLGGISRKMKRAVDMVAAGLLMALFLPVFLAIAALIRLSSRGPVLYSQERVGRGGHPFRAWKFRTMVPSADRVLANYLREHPELREEWETNHKLKDDPRVIRGIGRFLRNYSLDELPQLWNVFCGEMSLVGPRPIVEEEIPKYQDDFANYVQATPGITGLWQISGRNNTTYARRVFLDSYYIRNWSPWLDYYILLRTIKTVVLREGAY